MEIGDNLQGFRLGPVNNQVGVGREKLHRFIRQILAPMPPARSSRKINNLLADHGFNLVGHLKTGILLDIAPDLNEVERGFRRKNVAALHSGWAFSSAR